MSKPSSHAAMPVKDALNNLRVSHSSATRIVADYLQDELAINSQHLLPWTQRRDLLAKAIKALEDVLSNEL